MTPTTMSRSDGGPPRAVTADHMAARLPSPPFSTDPGGALLLVVQARARIWAETPAEVQIPLSRSSDGGGGYYRGRMDTDKYVRYTPGQVDALERVYAKCPKPTFACGHQLLRECPILAIIEPKQIMAWFQNRR
jgi:hypothetical protein